MGERCSTHRVNFAGVGGHKCPYLARQIDVVHDPVPRLGVGLDEDAGVGLLIDSDP